MVTSTSYYSLCVWRVSLQISHLCDVLFVFYCKYKSWHQEDIFGQFCCKNVHHQWRIMGAAKSGQSGDFGDLDQFLGGQILSTYVFLWLPKRKTKWPFWSLIQNMSVSDWYETIIKVQFIHTLSDGKPREYDLMCA